jgi:hypothetical protein
MPHRTDHLYAIQLSGAKVLLINGQDPWLAVDANAAIGGSFQAFGTRQNGFFSSYNTAATGWTYILGQFAQQALPLTDSVALTLQLVNSTLPVTVTLPYRSRIGAATVPFADSASFRANNCRAVDGTNGVDLNAPDASAGADGARLSPIVKFQQQAPVALAADRASQPLSVILDATPRLDVVLPPALTPAHPVNGSSGVAQFFVLPGAKEKTGVLALGSFSADTLDGLQSAMLGGLQTLKAQGATRLIVDVSNNGGGFICAAHWLHRIVRAPFSLVVVSLLLSSHPLPCPCALDNSLTDGFARRSLGRS